MAVVLMQDQIQHYAFREPMITYCTELPNMLATGCLNLPDSPALATCVLRHRLKIFHNIVRYQGR
jgi:hypothetical protein